jgi:hypothetical protein
MDEAIFRFDREVRGTIGGCAGHCANPRIGLDLRAVFRAGGFVRELVRDDKPLAVETKPVGDRAQRRRRHAILCDRPCAARDLREARDAPADAE